MSAVFSVSLPIYFCCYTLSTVITLKKKWIIPLIVNTLIFSIIHFLGEYAYSIEKVMTGFFNPFFFIMGNVLLLTACFLKNKERKNEIFTV